MKALALSALLSVLAFIAGAMFEKQYEAAHATAPAKVIDWRPADRYEMVVASTGAVLRLDRATGELHVFTSKESYDVPEYRNDE